MEGIVSTAMSTPNLFSRQHLVKILQICELNNQGLLLYRLTSRNTFLTNVHHFSPNHNPAISLKSCRI